MFSPSSSVRPTTARKSSHVPGGFDDEDDDEAMPMDSARNYKKNDLHDPQQREVHETGNSSLPPLPSEGSSLLHGPGSEGDGSRNEWEEGTFDERDMRRNLMDIESSFIPSAPSPILQVNESRLDTTTEPAERQVRDDSLSRPGTARAADYGSTKGGNAASNRARSPPTPPESYQTPYPLREDSQERGRPRATSPTNYDPNTSSLEDMSSSPTAAAAARTISRAVSMATIGGYETADDRSPERSARSTNDEASLNGEGEATPRKSKAERTTASQPGSPTRSGSPATVQDIEEGGADKALPAQHGQGRKRPKFLNSRHASQRLSTSSFSTTTSTTTQDTGSEATLGADFALQSGGAAPANFSSGKYDLGLSRSISLGSIASGISGIGEGSGWEQGRNFSATSAIQGGTGASGERSLSRLDEERSLDAHGDKGSGTEDGQFSDVLPTETPKASKQPNTAPSDTVIAQHIRDIQVPASVARQYRERNRPPSPSKQSEMDAPKHGRGKGLALKEQISTIDRLHNQNWDLKLKIHFLDQALKRQSEEGVKEMISENVELKAGLASLEKQSRLLRKRNRELERKVKEQEEGLAKAKPATAESDDGSRGSASREVPQEMEEEIQYLRKTVETYEIETERMRNESVAREGEKRRLVEIVKTLGDRKVADPDVGAREEIEVWRELLAAETAHKDQALEQINQLREENWRLKDDATSTTSYYQKPQYGGSVRSEVTSDRPYSAASSTLVEHLRVENDGLRHETEELRRVNGAQTAMLTSRLRERERLCQELEDLKLIHMRGDGGRSIAGDSILERSASRAYERSVSRASGGTKVTAISDTERDEYETNIGRLRDQVAEMKLRNQDLESSLETHLNELESLEGVKGDLDLACKRYEEEMDELTSDLQTMQQERNELIQRNQAVEAEFEDLKNEAQTEVDNLEAGIDERDQSIQSLENDLANREENFNALQNEMRSMSEVIVRLEDDHEANLRKLKSLQQEAEDSNRELETLEKSLREANGKVERLTVQQESSQGEINFLREEQDGDKIKIGDLESALKRADLSIGEEKDRSKELDERLKEERHQREVVGSKEKQEVQKIVNDLNREAATAKDEARKLRKSLSSREVEATEWKERLIELENNLREALGDLSGTRSSLLKSVTKLQKELDATLAQLEIAKTNLAEREELLRDRDALLENSSLEFRKLSDLIERERQARRADKHHFDQTHRVSQQTIRTLTQHETRVVELESGRQSDRKKINVMESEFRERLQERNNLLLALWNRMSAVCGADWAHSNSFVNGRLPSLEVVSSQLPAFSKNLLAAVKTIEGLVGGFKIRVRTIEKDLWKQYQTVEHNLDVRMKKLDRLEAIIQGRQKMQGLLGTPASSSSQASAEVIAKLRGENRLLKAEIGVLQRPDQQQQQHHGRRSPSASSSTRLPRPGLHKAPTNASTLARKDENRAQHGRMSMTRHHSTSAMEMTERNGAGNSADPSEERWINRLRELERRLKEEREARMLDRTGARRRIEEGLAAKDELRLELERERVRNGET
ncbi:MAG: hypothetical protein M4579_006836 [Chaenotheca gracillima]|nr:MAG: hypothetical protein M4579_006836 [Chaenotheca gracillima]